MAKINRVMVGESLVGDGNEVAHIDLVIGPRGSAAETAFVNALSNNKDGFTTLLAVIAPNLPCKPNTIMFNKVTIKDARQAVQMFGPAQYGVAKAVQDSVAEGVIPANEADDLYVLVGVFIHWEAADDAKIQDYNYRATKEALASVNTGPLSRPTGYTHFDGVCWHSTLGICAARRRRGGGRRPHDRGLPHLAGDGSQRGSERHPLGHRP